MNLAESKYNPFHPSPFHQELRENIANFSREQIAPQARKFDEQEKFNAALFQRLATELNLFGITLPEADGGLGLDPVAAVIIHEEMSKYDPAFTMSYLAHEILFINNIGHSANREQKLKYLPEALSASKITGMAMTEPEAGTDVLSMRTVARKEGNHYILNGTKQFITNGPIGDYFLVYAKTDLSRKEISSFIVEKNFSGFSVGKKEMKMGMKASPTSQLVFEDMKVPVENLIGKENEATVPMMRNLEIERITLAAQSLGIAARSLEIMSQYSNERFSFGVPLHQHGQIEHLIGHAFAQYSAARALVYQTAAAIDPQKRNSLDAAAAKYVATTMAEEVSRIAIQVLGGYGYTRDYDLERLHRDAILLSIGGGTNEAMKKNIIADIRRMLKNNSQISFT